MDVTITHKDFYSYIDLSYTLTPETDIIETYGFLFYYRTKITKARYNHVHVSAEVVLSIDNDKPMNKFLKECFEKSSRPFTKKADYCFDFKDNDGTTFHNCFIKSINEKSHVTTYNLVFDWAENPNGTPEKLNLVGDHKIPLNVTDNVLEYIKNMK